MKLVQKLLVAVVVGGLVTAVAAPYADARSVRGERRAYAHRQDVRQEIRRDIRQDRRQARRVARRVARRHYHALPRVHRVVVVGGHRYYVWGGLYYYPYFFRGRLVYVEIDLLNGVPVAPPPPAAIQVEIDM